MIVSSNSGSVTTAGNAAAPPSEPVVRRAPPAAAAPAAPPLAGPTRAEVEKAVATLNKFTQLAAQDVRFSIDDESGRTVIKVVDQETQAILRQIPSVEALALSRSLDRMQGLLLRDKA